MTKERLIQIKKDTVKQETAYKAAPYLKIEDSELQKFSVAQLELMCDILNRTLANRDEHNPFVTLSATEVMQKETGKVAVFEESGNIREEAEDEVLSGASAEIYRKAVK